MPPISEVFDEICQLALALGVKNINQLPACWEHKVDEEWRIAVNAHNKPVNAGDTTVPAFTAYLEFNGWPAGLISPYGGMMASGAIANEVELLKALRSARTRAEQKGIA